MYVAVFRGRRPGELPDASNPEWIAGLVVDMSDDIVLIMQGSHSKPRSGQLELRFLLSG